MENPVGQPAGAVDSTYAPNPRTTKSPPVQVSRCHCREPHHGHEPTNVIAQLEALYLNEAAGSNSIPSTAHPSNPSKPNTTPPSTRPAFTSDTPRKMSSSNGMVVTRHNERKGQVGKEIKDVKEELCVYCFLSSFFPAFQDCEYRERMDSLPLLTSGKFKLTSLSALHSASREPWPTGSNKKLYYSPLASLLNEIVDHFNGIVNPNNSKTIRFIVYDKQMAPVTPTSLKPNLLLVEEKFIDLDSLQWKHPIIPIEVKDDFWDALKQIGSYAREMFVARPGRQICWALYFHPSESTFQVILFTPDRVHYTQPTTITSAVGYREMVKVIVALLSQPDRLTIGEDTSRDTLTKLLPNGDRLEIQEMEFDRKSLVGRKSRIMSVTVVGRDGKGVDSTVSGYGDSPASIRESGRTRNPPRSLNRHVIAEQVPEESPSTATLPSSSRQSRVRSSTTSPSAAIPPSSFRQLCTRSITVSPKGKASASSPSAATQPSRPRTRSAATSFGQKQDDFQPTLQEITANLEAEYILKEIRENPNERITFAENRASLKIGEHLVIKESWPLRSRQDIEWDALMSCLREFGVPEVVYKVTGKHPMPVECTHEPRVPQHIALREKGTRLQDATSPQMLLTALVHAMIGHWNFFRNGWLHRDVSIGNVLVLSVSVPKSPPAGLGVSENLTECHGILIDGDAMIHSASDRKLGDHRSCTPPFLSRRLVRQWVGQVRTFDQYFDDLEAFAWVLLWALVEIAEANNGATTFDRQLIESLSETDLLRLKRTKTDVVNDLKILSGNIADRLPKEESTSLLDPFIMLLDQWFDLIPPMGRHGNDGTLRSSEDSTQFYKTFIILAMDKIPDLPTEWHF